MQPTDNGTSRRSFIKTAAVSAGAATALAACGRTPTSPSVDPGGSPTEQPAGLPITLAGYTYDRVNGIVDGSVPIEGCAVTFEEGSIGDLNTHIFSGPRTIEVTEIGLHPFMLAFANNDFRAYSLLPVFPLRLFRHKSVFIRTDRGIQSPEDLRGRVIGTTGYASTSLTWLRGIFQHEYGISPKDVEWVIASKDSDARSGKTSKQEQSLPDGVPFRLGPKGVDESELLISGKVDALFHAAEPKAYREGHPMVERLFPDLRRAEGSSPSCTLWRCATISSTPTPGSSRRCSTPTPRRNRRPMPTSRTPRGTRPRFRGSELSSRRPASSWVTTTGRTGSSRTERPSTLSSSTPTSRDLPAAS